MSSPPAVPERNGKRADGPAAAVPLVLTQRVVSRPELVLAPAAEPLERVGRLAVADEEVLEHVAAVLRRHPSFAQQINRAYRTGTDPPTPSPRAQRRGTSAWFESVAGVEGQRGGQRGGESSHGAPLALRHRNTSESEVSGEPSQRGWRPVWRRSFYVLTTTALLAISGQVYQERKQRLDFEEQRERMRTASLSFGQAVRSALTMQSGLIVVNLVLAMRGVQASGTFPDAPGPSAAAQLSNARVAPVAPVRSTLFACLLGRGRLRLCSFHSLGRPRLCFFS